MEELAAYRAMRRIRCFEEEAQRLKMDGQIAGAVHLGNGQEAVCIGAVSALNVPADVVFATYRGHGWALACGVPPHRLFAEMLGRATGTNGGRGGSAYLSSPKYGFYGENAIVGAGAPAAPALANAVIPSDSDIEAAIRQVTADVE